MNPKKSKDRLYLFRRLGEAVDADLSLIHI